MLSGGNIPYRYCRLLVRLGPRPWHRLARTLPAQPVSLTGWYSPYGSVPLAIVPTVQGDPKARHSGSRPVLAS